jgi:hypothetical protein
MPDFKLLQLERGRRGVGSGKESVRSFVNSFPSSHVINNSGHSTPPARVSDARRGNRRGSKSIKGVKIHG